MHAFTALSNFHLHYMLSATMPGADPLFLDYMLGNIARPLSKLRGRSRRVLEPAQLRIWVAATRTGATRGGGPDMEGLLLRWPANRPHTGQVAESRPGPDSAAVS
ncbi:MAG: hypothetical protein R3B06_26145 [Kofleriaceae bacterium]